MKSTILTKKDAKLIEKAILRYGRILSTQELLSIFKEEYSQGSAYKRINLLAQAGWFRRIKRGLYLVIDNLTARSQIDISLSRVANALVNESYVSLSHALSSYQMFDQSGQTVVSITWQEGKRYKVDNYAFRFSHVKKNMYFGFREKLEQGKIVRIAEAEKALIDYLYLDKSFVSASLVFEKLRDYHQELDLEKLQTYAARANITIQREIGFMLDQLDLDSSLLYRKLKGNRGTSRFTTEAKLFSAKWRLYYDDRIIR